MDLNVIKLIVKNYEHATVEDIEKVIKYIANVKKQELGIDFVFETTLDDGAVLKNERTPDGRMQVEVGLSNLYDIDEARYLGIDYDKNKARGDFVETILSTFHELRHVEQRNNIEDNPLYNDEMTYKITRERVINVSFPGFINLYNYENSYAEIDAMRASLIDTVNFFKYMEVNITPDEVFQVMKERELKYLNYNLDNFGNTYESALNYFDYIYNNPGDIKGYPEILNKLSEDKKIRFNNECVDLHEAYFMEEDNNIKLDILMEESLRLNPLLYDKYPLLQNNTIKK